MKTNIQKTYFAGGCFWGVEYCFRNVEGVVSTCSGYMGGTKQNPAYEEVCGGQTGHAETLEVIYDENKTDFETLSRLFFEIHDFTQLNRQGADIGEQYRSAIFYVDENQKKVAEKLLRVLKEKGYAVATQLSPAGTFFPAEDYHQKYFEKTGRKPQCHFRGKIF